MYLNPTALDVSFIEFFLSFDTALDDSALFTAMQTSNYNHY